MTINDRLSPEALARARRLLLLATVLMIGLVFVTPVARVVAETIDPSRATVSGTVFDDRDGDGVRDQNEHGVEGVLVSDGVSIVQTGGTGGYELEVDPERRITDLVFITQPSGYTVPNDEFMTPRFWADLGQLGADDERVADFALTRVPGSEDDEFSFANIADPHVNPQLPEQIREINATKDELDFIQVSGDLTNSATNAEFEAYLAATAESELPVWPAVGNHEYQSTAGTTYAARIDNYRKYVGPEWYSFDYGNRHFVVIENNGQASQADQFEQQLQWFRRDLELNAQDKRVVVITHQPMNLTFGGNRAYDVYGDLLEQYGAELVLVGHAHSNDAEENSEFIPTAKHVQTNSSSYTVDQTPRGFRYVHMKGDTFENPFRVYGMDHTLVLTNPVPGASIAAGGLDEIQVNAYHSSDEVDRVVYQLDGRGPWYRMTRSGEMSWFSKWRGPRPSAGQHSIEIQAHGPGGQLWSKEETFTVAGGEAVVPAATNDWPQHQGDERHSGIATEDLGRDLDLAWIYRTPGTFLTGSPVIVDGVVYAGTRDENAENVSAVHAVDLATGRKLWEFPTDSSVSRTVAVHDGVVYAQSLRANLYAIDAATGEQLWMRSPEAAPEPYVQRRWGGWGVTVSDGKVLAYDVATGTRLWQSSNALSGTGGGVPSVGDGRVYVGEDNSVVARDAVTGADLWIHRSTGPSLQSNDAVTSTAAIAGETVYMGFPDGRVTALSAASGAVVWSTMLPGDIDQGGVFGSPVVTGDTVYVGANNGHVYGFDRATGAIVWDYETGAWNATGAAVTGNTLVFGSWDGNLYAFTKGS